MKQWIRYLNSVLKEAHWLNSGCLPKVDEYLNNGIVSPGVHLVLIHAFFLFDHIQDITKETIAILDDDFPNIMYSVAKILRLSDDLEGDKVKQMSILLFIFCNFERISKIITKTTPKF
jgi:(3S)-linalool synthase